MIEDTPLEEIDRIMKESWKAFTFYRKQPLKKRRDFMFDIARELEMKADDLVETASSETNLPAARLESELKRTINQLEQYAEACVDGLWLDARINRANAGEKMPDIRKILQPLGPVIVFGASNFPFAYSTAGGDTACAFAAGCSVVVKAHPAHAQTSGMVAEAIQRAVVKNDLPLELFAHIYGEGFETGKTLVMHDCTRAVGFTGSLQGGKQLFDWGNQRKVPIPVFSEMGSVNPVFLLPQKLSDTYEEIAEMFVHSITTSVGQFCTNPGLIIGIRSKELDSFIEALGNKISKIPASKMLHKGIASAYEKKLADALSQKGVTIVAQTEVQTDVEEGRPYLATVEAGEFLENNVLHREVFGPFSLIIQCRELDEMKQVALALEGQLTSTVFGRTSEIAENQEFLEYVKNNCGRLVLNAVPTGVTVCRAMHHGGPYPATTDSRFTAVGADGIKRFARPVCYQNWENELLPDELKDENPLGIWRWEDGAMKR